VRAAKSAPAAKSTRESGEVSTHGQVPPPSLGLSLCLEVSNSGWALRSASSTTHPPRGPLGLPEMAKIFNIFYLF
jgi:hypothetical protein